MSDEPVEERTESVEQLRRELVYTFGDYHSSIPVQIDLVDRLIAAAKREERRRIDAAQQGTGLGGTEDEPSFI